MIQLRLIQNLLFLTIKLHKIIQFLLLFMDICYLPRKLIHLMKRVCRIIHSSMAYKHKVGKKKLNFFFCFT